MVGLYLLSGQLVDVIGGFDPSTACLSIVREAAGREEELDALPDYASVATANLSLRNDVFGHSPGPFQAVELLGQVLMREFIPLAQPSTLFDYEIELGRGKLAPLRGVETIEDYAGVAESLALCSRAALVSTPSPMALPAALDCLGLLLDRDPRWDVVGPTLRLSGAADTASLVLYLPSLPAIGTDPRRT